MSGVTRILRLTDELLHALQYERGCSAVFLDSQGRIFGDRLKICRAVTDNAANACLSAIADVEQSGCFPKLSMVRLADIRTRLERLSGLRGKVDAFDMGYTAAVNAFTFEFTMPLIDSIAVLAHERPDHDSTLASAFAHFLQWKERIGRERAIGARGFYSFAFRNPEFRDRMVELMGEAKSYLESFMGLAAPHQIEIVRAALEGPEMRAVDEVYRRLDDNATSPVEHFSADEWFDLLSRVMDRLHDAEHGLIDALVEQAETQRPEIISSNSPAARLRPYVKNLPLFAKLGDNELNELLSHAQVREYPRGKLLFLQGEQAQRMYVVIRGWVKVYNGLESGEETILQMLTSGDTLLEAAVFLNTATPVSAQVIDDATLLSIPAPVIRQRVASSSALAATMLNTISLRSQMLIYQIEQNRLKDARARVGWFLLRLYLAQGGDGNTFKLPYDKSIIASYLDMRPETFSRVLKKMKAEGLEVANEKIALRDEKILCEFCDSYVARECPHALTAACPSRDRLDLEPEDIAQRA